MKKADKKIIVSLTSFPKRINTVHLVIESLLNQTHKADKVILWLTPEEFPNRERDLPDTLLSLIPLGLTIDWYHNLRSYTKLIPTLRKYPDDLIVTVDDDIVYRPTMIEKLYREHLRHPNDIICHRATKFIYNRDRFATIAGGYKYYRGASYLNKLTGAGGVLYPPKCFYKDILNEDLMLQLAPTNDDQWFWLMAVLNDVGVRVAKNNEPKLHYTPGSQEVGLFLINDNGEHLFWKDFERMMTYYPRLYKILRHAGRKSHLFYKERRGNKRKIYICGHQVLSYKKHSHSSSVAAAVPQNLTSRYISQDRLPIYLADKFYARTGKLPTEELTTFSEKIIWASMFDVTPLKVQCADKFAVREYVSKTIGDRYLPNLYAVYQNSDQFSLSELPESFVLTYNAGSGQNMIITDKAQHSEKDLKCIIRQWLLYNHADYCDEMQYRYIPPRVIARELLDIRTDIEYKLWCFGGRVEFIVLNSYRDGHDKIRVKNKDRNWNNMNFFQYGYGIIGEISEDIEKPAFLEEMIKISEKLAAPFDFVRVDFYETTDGRLVFGELTFSPTAGFLTYLPNNDIIQTRYGHLFKIPPRDEKGFAVRKK